MSVHRIMGLETEYGILAPGAPSASPMILSGLVVTSYAANALPRHTKSGWDYEDEDPLQDARGFSVPRAQAHPTQLTDEPRVASPSSDDESIPTANSVLTNGARLYVDHAHPEYSTPEVTNPLDAVRFDAAGELIMRRAADYASTLPEYGEVRLYKNNTDNKGASYGTHENYTMPRDVPFHRIITGLLPFFASRLLFTGNGRVGIGVHGQQAGYQISSRADYMETEVGLETTLRRPLVNTRDEPHANPDKYRRLHVIVGDANRFQTATFLKMGTTALVLSLIEAERSPSIELRDPVAALKSFSRDVRCQTVVDTADGKKVSALDIQWMYYEEALKLVQERQDDDPGGLTARTLDLWHDVLTGLGTDPMSQAHRLDWVAKLKICQGYVSRDNLAWDHARLELVDVQYSDMRAGKGLFDKLHAKGRVEDLVSPEDVQAAVLEPPHDTRAYFRGKCIEKFGPHVAAASWDSVIVDAGGQSLRRIPMMEPSRGGKAQVDALLESASTPAELLAKLTGE